MSFTSTLKLKMEYNDSTKEPHKLAHLGCVFGIRVARSKSRTVQMRRPAVNFCHSVFTFRMCITIISHAHIMNTFNE